MYAVFAAKDGYDRRKNPIERGYRYMTVQEAQQLRSGGHVQFEGKDGRIRNLKVNGRPKTWKREPGRVEVPMKYGMYECDRVSNQPDGRVGNGIAFLVVQLPES